MRRSKQMLLVGTALFLAASAAVAAPVSYSFSTGTVLPFGGSTPVTGPLNAEATAIAGMLSGTSVAGSFIYDSAALAIAPNNPDGSTTYRGSTPESVTGFVTVLSNVTATVGAFSFSDISGLATVGNGTLGGNDIFALSIENFGTGGTHNIVPFSIGGYTLWNMRMLWIEGQAVPTLVPDLFDNQALLSAPPDFYGRLALDFKKTGEAGSGTQFHVFYDSLLITPTIAAIPEPQSYAMLLAGLGLLGWEARRRKKRQHLMRGPAPLQ